MVIIIEYDLYQIYSSVTYTVRFLYCKSFFDSYFILHNYLQSMFICCCITFTYIGFLALTHVSSRGQRLLATNGNFIKQDLWVIQEHLSPCQDKVCPCGNISCQGRVHVETSVLPDTGINNSEMSPKMSPESLSLSEHYFFSLYF